jgi:glycosyltransferase involved in cell wall biosynthesis
MARILQVCNVDFTLRIFIAPLVRALVQRGHEVECVCQGTQIPRDVLGPGVHVHQFAFPRASSPVQFARAVWRLRRLIRAGRYACVNSHNRNASIVGRIAAWMERVPINLYSAHGCYFHDDQSRLAFEATVCLEALLARLTDYTLSQSQQDTEFLIRRRIVSPARIATIGNGIDTERFSPMADSERRIAERELGLPPAQFRIGAIGRLVKGKGFMDLLEAFGRIADGRAADQLLIVGGNIDHDIEPYHDRFRQRARELGLDGRVFVTGITSQVERHLGTCDVFVLPSYREGMPRVLLEAMAMGLPTVATDIRGCREITVDGQTGLIYPPHDIQRLAELLDRLRGSAATRGEMGRLGRQRVRERFTESQYVSRQVDRIECLLDGTRAR